MKRGAHYLVLLAFMRGILQDNHELQSDPLAGAPRKADLLSDDPQGTHPLPPYEKLTFIYPFNNFFSLFRFTDLEASQKIK